MPVDTMGKRVGTRMLRHSLMVVAATTLTVSASAFAFQVETDNPDLAMRWDNTIRYNLGVRADKIGNIGNSVNSDEGDYKFKRGDVVTNRVDVLSEFDFTFQNRYGFRVSGALWYDDAYSDTTSKRNPALPSSAVSSYNNGQYSNYTKRYYRGPSGEFLDAFVFGKFKLGEMPLTVKAGQHTVYWGESLGLSGSLHGVAYAQMPLDLRKGFATPGVEGKELFLPLNNISAQLVPTENLTVAAQYFFDWAPTRIPEGGTYLGPADFLTFGADRASATNLNKGIVESKRRGDWGVMARWTPDFLDGTVGVYYRNYTDKLPGFLRNGTATAYREYYAEDIDMYGLSLSKQFGSVSVGGEVSLRRNTPLTSQTLGNALPSSAGQITQLFPNGVPELIGNSYQARGNTLHMVLNAVGVVANTGFFDSASWSAELIYSRLEKVTKNQDMFYGEGYGVCNKSRRAALGSAFRDKWDGCATKDVLGVALTFNPTWLQVFPGTDLSAPMAISTTTNGNAATQLGGNERNGSFSLGLGADMYAKYRFDLRYVGYFGKTKEAAAIVPGLTQTTTGNGLSTLLEDRGFFAFTFKTTL